MSSYKDYDYLFNFIIVGDSGVGKSCLLLRFADDCYMESHIATIGCDFKIRTVNLDGSSCKLHLWDTAGQDRFKTITTNYYRGAHGVILVYDVTDPDSFLHLSTWLEEVDNYAREGVVKLLVGNKCDLSTKKLVTHEQAQAFSQSVGIPFIETSAKNSKNVDQAFMTLTSNIKASVVDGTLKENKAKEEVRINKTFPVKTDSQCMCSM